MRNDPTYSPSTFYLVPTKTLVVVTGLKLQINSQTQTRDIHFIAQSDFYVGASTLLHLDLDTFTVLSLGTEIGGTRETCLPYFRWNLTQAEGLNPDTKESESQTLQLSIISSVLQHCQISAIRFNWRQIVWNTNYLSLFGISCAVDLDKGSVFIWMFENVV